MKTVSIGVVLLAVIVAPAEAQTVPETEWYLTPPSLQELTGRRSGPMVFNSTAGKNEHGQMVWFHCSPDRQIELSLHDQYGLGVVGDTLEVAFQTDDTPPRVIGSLHHVDGVPIISSLAPQDAGSVAQLVDEAAAATRLVVFTVEAARGPEPRRLTFDPTGLAEMMARLSCMDPGTV